MSDSRDVSFEFPSIEHPVLLQLLIEEAQRRDVPIHRVSMGGGTRMLTNSERDDMLSQAHEHGIDVYSFISSRNSFETLVDQAAAEQLRGEVAFRDAIEELHLCSGWGVNGVLLADLGLLDAANKLRVSGDLPRACLQNFSSHRSDERFGCGALRETRGFEHQCVRFVDNR